MKGVKMDAGKLINAIGKAIQSEAKGTVEKPLEIHITVKAESIISLLQQLTDLLKSMELGIDPEKILPFVMEIISAAKGSDPYE